jgi:Domain of unknown function (DUF4760)
MQPQIAILIGAALATVGWLYTARRARALSRKQHTVNIMLQASLNKDFRDTLDRIGPYLRRKNLPDLENNEYQELKLDVRMIGNHYEFMAAGVRNGDFDERLLRDSERGTIVMLFEGLEAHVWQLRNSRSRMAIYEHLEWLHGRWTQKRPAWWQRALEWCIGRPIAGKRARMQP